MSQETQKCNIEQVAFFFKLVTDAELDRRPEDAVHFRKKVNHYIARTACEIHALQENQLPTTTEVTDERQDSNPS